MNPRSIHVKILGTNKRGKLCESNESYKKVFTMCESNESSY